MMALFYYFGITFIWLYQFAVLQFIFYAYISNIYCKLCNGKNFHKVKKCSENHVCFFTFWELFRHVEYWENDANSITASNCVRPIIRHNKTIYYNINVYFQGMVPDSNVVNYLHISSLLMVLPVIRSASGLVDQWEPATS